MHFFCYRGHTVANLRIQRSSFHKINLSTTDTLVPFDALLILFVPFDVGTIRGDGPRSQLASTSGDVFGP
jgi:hypothetical protein